MDASNDIMIRISPNEGKITVEEDAQGVFSRKSITEEDLLRCFKDSLRTADEGYPAAEYYLALSKRDGKTLRSLAPQAVRRCFGLRYALSPLPDPSSGIWLFAQSRGESIPLPDWGGGG